MRWKRLLLTLATITISIQYALAQHTIEGVVLDSRQKLLAGATVALYHAADSLPLRQTISDSVGRFQFSDSISFFSSPLILAVSHVTCKPYRQTLSTKDSFLLVTLEGE